MTAYNILNEATIRGTSRGAWELLIAALDGADPWWSPFLVGRRAGPVSVGAVGSVLDLRVNTRGVDGGFWDRAHWVARVIDVDPGRRLVLESVRGDFRGTMRVLLDPVGAGSTHLSIRFLGDPAGGLRWRSPFVDVPAGFRAVAEEGFHRLQWRLQHGQASAA